MDTSPSDNSRLVSVDLLRALAAMMVVIYHARAEFWNGFAQSWAANGLTTNPLTLAGYATLPFSLGWFGVQIFFVLSGYCIHRRFALELAKSEQYQMDWKRFFIRRFVRIYPVYLVALFATAAVDHVYLQQGGTITVGELSWSAFFASIFTLQGIVSPMFGTNTVFWTLSIEMHLYLFYPVLFTINRELGANKALAFALVVSVLYVAAHWLFDLQLFFPYAHGGGPIFLPFVFMWAAGAFLADMSAGRTFRLSGPFWTLLWMVMLGGGFLLHMRTDEVTSAIPLAVGAAGLVNWVKDIDFTRFHAMRPLIPSFLVLGAISYSLYATHRIAFGLINISGFDGQSGTILKVLLAVACAIVLAWVSYFSIEKASLNLSSRFSSKPTRTDARVQKVP